MSSIIERMRRNGPTPPPKDSGDKQSKDSGSIAGAMPPMSSGGDSSKQGYYFDPSGLERAAKAVKDLDASKNASRAFEIVKEEEHTRQLEVKAQISRADAAGKDLDLQRVRAERELLDEKIAKQTRMQRETADYQNRLKREQQRDFLAAQRRQKEEDVKRQEAAVARHEALRRETIEYESELRRATEVAKVQAETDGNIKRERVNHKLHLEKARVEASEYRQTMLEGISLASSTIGQGVMAILGDKDRLLSAAGVISLAALGVYAARTGTGIAGRFIEARLGKPSLVRETSRLSLKSALSHPIRNVRALLARDTHKDVLSGVILEPSTQERLRSLATAVKNTKTNKAPFRNVLFHGPPGTGKTLYAKALAHHSGLDYAILTGGDLSPLGDEAVTELHKLFDWAENSGKGVLIFIDEADAFLRKRTDKQMSAPLRNALNAFLYRTGESSTKFMLVMSSNQPDQFDWAVNDRIDEMVHMHLPGKSERLAMLRMYMRKYIFSTSTGEPTSTALKPITFDPVTDEDMEKFAVATEGFSGREISKLSIAWQAAAYGTEDTVLTHDMLYSILEHHLAAHRNKHHWGRVQAELEERETSNE